MEQVWAGKDPLFMIFLFPNETLLHSLNKPWLCLDYSNTKRSGWDWDLSFPLCVQIKWNQLMGVETAMLCVWCFAGKAWVQLKGSVTVNRYKVLLIYRLYPMMQRACPDGSGLFDDPTHIQRTWRLLVRRMKMIWTLWNSDLGQIERM